jgi:PKD repeat protein
VTDRAPVAVIRASPASPGSGQLTTFDGSGSSDPDGRVVAWHWTFGDGASAAGGSAPHTYARPGTYTVGLTVSDDSGSTGSATQQVTVSERCVVPNLRGKTLTRARRLLRLANCRGRTRSARQRSARRVVVTSQQPDAGTVLPAGSRVTEKVRGRRRR